MTEKLQVLLRDAVQDVLEKMFFVRSSGDGDDGPQASADSLAVRVAFEGAESGTLLLGISRHVARSISADFLGTEDELADQQIDEVVSELSNMICGSVLSRLDTSGTFRIGAPRSEPAEMPPFNGCEFAEHSCSVAGGRLTAIIAIEAPVC